MKEGNQKSLEEMPTLAPPVSGVLTYGSTS